MASRAEEENVSRIILTVTVEAGEASDFCRATL